MPDSIIPILNKKVHIIEMIVENMLQFNEQ